MKAPRSLVLLTLLGGSFAAPVAEIAGRQIPGLGDALQPVLAGVQGLLGAVSPLLGQVPGASNITSCATSAIAALVPAGVAAPAAIPTNISSLSPEQVTDILTNVQQLVTAMSPLSSLLPTQKRQDPLGDILTQVTNTLGTATSLLGGGNTVNIDAIGGTLGPVVGNVQDVLSALGPVLGAIPGAESVASCFTGSVTSTGASLGDVLAPLVGALGGLVGELQSLLGTVVSAASSAVPL